MTADGDTVDGLLSWQKLHVNQPELIARGFTEEFVTYATGTPIRYSDEPTIDRIVTDSKASGYGLRPLIHAVLTRDLFRKKRIIGLQARRASECVRDSLTCSLAC